MRQLLALLLAASLWQPVWGLSYNKEKPARIEVPTKTMNVDPVLLQNASKIGGDGFTPVGRWLAQNTALDARFLPQELNVRGRATLQRIFNAPDREGTVIQFDDHVIYHVESAQEGGAAMFRGGEFVGFTKDSPEVPARKFGEYNIRHEDVFAKPTATEKSLAAEAAKVPEAKARRLRAQGFVPLSEVAGGTPYAPSRIQGWVRPFREGVSTFPETD